MRMILLTQGKFAIVSDADFNWLNQWKWLAKKNRKINPKFYAFRFSYDKEKREGIFMHRLIKDCPEGQQVDHRNLNTLDNRRRNLRICSHTENMRNTKKRIDNISGFIGVSWSERRKKWRSRILVNRKEISLGAFVHKIDAAKAYDQAAKILHGKFCKLNFPKL